MVSVKDKTATSSSSASAPVDFVRVLNRLFAVGVLSVVVAYILSIQGTQFFNAYVAVIDVKNPIGFGVILFLSVLCQVLTWSVPAMVAGSLTRTSVKCIGAWFDFSLRMVCVVLFSLLMDIGWEKLIMGEGVQTGENFQRVLLRAFDRFHYMLTLRTVEHIRTENVMLSTQLLFIFTYLALIMFVLMHIKRIFLPNKLINFFNGGLILISISFVSSFLFSVFDAYLSDVWTKPIFFNSFWIINNKVSLISILRAVVFWIDLLFVVLILQITSPDRDDSVREVAAPAFVKFD
jgi:hypothetical protein